MALSLIAAGLYESSQASWEENTLSRARYQAGVLAESVAGDRQADAPQAPQKLWVSPFVLHWQ